MLRASDIMAGKIAVQLGLLPADEVRAELRRLRDAPTDRDLVNRFTDAGKLPPKEIELVRQRVALYDHVRGEASYVRLLEKNAAMPKTEVARLIAQLERSAFRRRLGDVLIRQGQLSKKQDELLRGRQRELLEKEDARVLERYVAEDFAGVAKPLIPGSRLEPDDFKISTLFRSKETRALVHRSELEALGVEEGEAPPAESAATRSQRPSGESIRSLERIGEYEVVEVLGVGGMGAVFLCQREGTGEFVAVKVMLHQAASAAERGRFRREIELSRRIRHPNVISVIDSATTEDGMTYLVVPALAGKELRTHLDAAGGKGLAADVACRVLEQVLDGLQAVHDAGIVHRDLKPENVFVLAGHLWEIKLMDFGLAKLQGGEGPADGELFKTLKGEIVGSPAYVSPEAIANDPVDGRTDLYSLGIVFFEMLTGVRPLESETAQGYLTQHLVCPPLTLAEARPDLPWPPEVESLVARMLGKSLADRPASARAVLEELRGGVKAKLVAAHFPASVPPTAVLPPPDPTKPLSMSARGLLGRLQSPV